jgi:hypothetical protein
MKIISIQPHKTKKGLVFFVYYENGDQLFCDNIKILENFLNSAYK